MDATLAAGAIAVINLALTALTALAGTIIAAIALVTGALAPLPWPPKSLWRIGQLFMRDTARVSRCIIACLVVACTVRYWLYIDLFCSLL